MIKVGIIVLKPKVPTKVQVFGLVSKIRKELGKRKRMQRQVMDRLDICPLVLTDGKEQVKQGKILLFV